MPNRSQYAIVRINTPIPTSLYAHGIQALRLDPIDNLFAIPKDDVRHLETRTIRKAAMPVVFEVLAFSRALELLNEKAEILCNDLRERLQCLSRRPHQKETRFFLRYDALVHAALLFYIEQGQVPHNDILDFLHPRPHLNGLTPTDIQDFVAILQKRVNARRPNVPAPDISNTQQLATIDGLARYQWEIFNSSFPPSNGKVCSSMVRAFSLFSDDQLALAKPADRYNACPDSSLYFCFAEFAIHASRPDRGIAQASYWESFLRMIVPLEHVYYRRYHKELPMTQREIESLLEEYSRYDRKDLIREHTNIVWTAASDVHQ